MAGGKERELRRRIRGVSATRKITRAMELIAASQIVRAQGRIAGARPYVRAIEGVLAAVAREAVGAERFLGEPESPGRALLLTVVSDRGLAGGYNNAVLRTTLRRAQELEASRCALELVTVGRKALSFFRFNRRDVSQGFTKMTDRPTFEDARRVAEAVVPPFRSGEVDLVEIVSTRFISPGTQRVEIRRLLPLVPPPEHVAAHGRERRAPVLYEFEPSPEELLQLLVPQYAEAVLYQTLLEASASEHTARQRAMASATENADELIVSYRRAMNRVRQDSITTEIMEIVGGAEALRQAGGSDRGRRGLGSDDEEQSA